MQCSLCHTCSMEKFLCRISRLAAVEISITHVSTDLIPTPWSTTSFYNVEKRWYIPYWPIIPPTFTFSGLKCKGSNSKINFSESYYLFTQSFSLSSIFKLISIQWTVHWSASYELMKSILRWLTWKKWIISLLFIQIKPEVVNSMSLWLLWRPPIVTTIFLLYFNYVYFHCHVIVVLYWK